MKRIVLLLFALFFVVFGLIGCSKYSSHYNAVGHVYSSDSDSARTSFMEFEGTEVFKLKCKSKNIAGITYSGKLEMGSATVYCDCGGTKTELFSIHSGEEVDSCYDYLPEDTVYIIIETSEKCQNGDFTFEIFYG